MTLSLINSALVGGRELKKLFLRGLPQPCLLSEELPLQSAWHVQVQAQVLEAAVHVVWEKAYASCASYYASSAGATTLQRWHRRRLGILRRRSSHHRSRTERTEACPAPPKLGSAWRLPASDRTADFACCSSRRPAGRKAGLSGYKYLDININSLVGPTPGKHFVKPIHANPRHFGCGSQSA